MWGRKTAGADAAPAPAAPENVEAPGPRADGPFDVTERPNESHDEYVDLGSLLIKMRGDIEVQLPTEDDVVTAVLVTRGTTPYLSHSLDAVLASSVEPAGVVVVDVSTDSSAVLPDAVSDRATLVRAPPDSRC